MLPYNIQIKHELTETDAHMQVVWRKDQRKFKIFEKCMISDEARFCYADKLTERIMSWGTI